MEKNQIEEKNNSYNNDPKDIELLCTLTTDSYSQYILDNSFIIFTSIDNILCLIYYNEKK